MGKTIVMGNDEFILYIRKNHPTCKTRTADLGRMIWQWIIEKDPVAIQHESDLGCLWDTRDTAISIHPEILPKTATQFKFERYLLPELYDYLDELGMQ
jgi:hypothetical protein